MSVYFQEDPPHIVVRGKTYPYRDLMRSLGGAYFASEKTWNIPLTASNVERISELCKSVGGGRSKDAPTAAAPVATPLATEAAEPKALTADGISISELMQKVQLIIAQGFPRSVWVLGEIQNIRFHASGVYFQLADFKEGASRSATLTVNATLWKSQLLELERKHGPEIKDILQDGQRVRLLVDVTLYKDRGQVSLQVQGLDPQFTKGTLALAREKLLRELRAKGLDRQNKSLAVPAFPLRIGLISAEGSRAQSDFTDQLRVYAYPGEVIFHPAQMQGEKTLSEVVRGIDKLVEAACDLIVITRGGGSAADLRWFDSPEIAYAIAASPIPIIAAIGHHEDVCIAEEICMQREKTPTAAADFIISLCQRTRDRLDQFSLILSQKLGDRVRIQAASLQGLREKILLLSQRVISTYRQHEQQVRAGLELQVQRRLLHASGRLTQLNQALMQQSDLRLQNQLGRTRQLSQTLLHVSQSRLQREEQTLPQLRDRLRAGIQTAFFTRHQQLSELEKNILPRDPRPWLAEGWTQLSLEQETGKVVKASKLKVGMQLKARLADAVLELTIKSIKKRKGEGTDA